MAFHKRRKKIKAFIFKSVMYLVMLGLPISLVVFLVLGIVWLAKQLF